MNEDEKYDDISIYYSVIDVLKELGINEWWRINAHLYTLCLDNSSKYFKYLKLLNIIYAHAPYISLVMDLFGYFAANIVYKLSKKCNYDYIGGSLPSKNVLFFTAPSRWNKQYKSDNKNFISVHVDYNNIVANLPSNIFPEYIYYNRWFLASIKHYVQILTTSQINTKHLMMYCNTKVLRSELKILKQNIKLSKQIDRVDYQIISTLAKKSHKSISEIRKIIKSIILIDLTYSYVLDHLMDNCVKSEKPDCIFLTGEQNIEGKSCTIAAYKNQIPIIGLQHGIISYNSVVGNIAYGHNGHYTRNCTSHEIPIPDLTLVWGDEEYEFLVNTSGYPKNAVKVTGSPNYDRLYASNKKYSRDAYCRQHFINPDKKIILLITPTLESNVKENMRYFNIIFTTLSNMKNVVLIIKQHPTEKAVHYEIINEYLHKFNLEVIVSEKNADTTELVYISDLVILKNSTVGQEAVAFHKPLLVLDFSENPDIAGYVNYGVATGVYDEATFNDKLCYALFHQHLSIEQQRDNYIQKRMFKIDGQASRRCAEVIKEFIEYS